MDFFNTILGNNLAHVLIECLPKLAERKQYIEEVHDAKVANWVADKIAHGYRFVASMKGSREGHTLIIIEK